MEEKVTQHHIALLIQILCRFSCLTILLITFCGANLNAQITAAKNPNEGQFITVEGIRLHYVVKGTGQPVVLLHGNPGFLQDYSVIVSNLASANFQAIAFDRPGHGLSQKSPRRLANPEAQATLLHEALIKLGISKPILVGHSLGGTLALNYVLKFPDEVSGVVLLAPAAYPEHDGFSFQNLLVQVPLLSSILIKVFKPYIHKQIKRGLECAFAPAGVPPQYLELAQSLWANSTSVRATIADDHARQVRLREVSGSYQTIHLPVAIVTGDADRIVNPVTDAYPLHQAIKGSRLAVLPHTGHEIPQSDPSAVVEAIELVWRLIPKS